MNIIRTEIKALVTADGLNELGEHVRVGDVYELDLDRIADMRWGFLGREGSVVRMSVWVLTSDNGHGGWMPIEFFDVPL